MMGRVWKRRVYCAFWQRKLVAEIKATVWNRKKMEKRRVEKWERNATRLPIKGLPFLFHGIFSLFLLAPNNNLLHSLLYCCQSKLFSFLFDLRGYCNFSFFFSLSQSLWVYCDSAGRIALRAAFPFASSFSFHYNSYYNNRSNRKVAQ